MTRFPTIKAGMAFLAMAIAVTSFDAANAAPANVRVRGTIISYDGTTLTVKTREGATAKIALESGWKVSSVAKASIADIKVGDFLGIASIPKAEGGDNALEVVIFPPALKGTGEGSRPWDAKPNSSMTNATVAKSVKSVDGKTVTLTYQGKEKKISIPQGVPVVTFATATKDDLKAGAVVFVPSRKADDGSISSERVVVSTKGVVPPM